VKRIIGSDITPFRHSTKFYRRRTIEKNTKLRRSDFHTDDSFCNFTLKIIVKKKTVMEKKTENGYRTVSNEKAAYDADD